MALTFSVFGESNTAIQFVQILCDGLAAVIIFLIVAELLPVSAAVVASMMAAFSPQFAWNSVLLLPDSLAVLPILLAVYCLARAARNPRLVTFIIAGALVGISCWLRANAMLLTFFLAAVVPLLFKGKKQWRYALAIIFGTLAIVMPLTIRNAIVFHRFIPLSLGAGQTLLEGIADYDPMGRFNIPSTDLGIMKQEAEDFHRPDYYGTLFNPDGVERERARLGRGFAVIRSHPFWFAGVMARRASSMMRLERARVISTQPAVSHSLEPRLYPYLVLYPYSMVKDAITPSAQIRVDEEGGRTGVLTIVGDNSRYGVQAAWPVTVQPNTDYLLQTVVKVESGRMRISIVSADDKILSSAVVDAIETTKAEEQPYALVQLAFVTDNAQPRIVFSNEPSSAPNPVIKVGPVAFDDLGPARFLWTRYPRFLVHGIQKLFLTAVILPLAILGLALLIIRKHGRALIILSVVPVYFFSVQSIVHTEYRYVLAVDYFLFALAAVTLSWVTNLVIARTSSLLAHKS